MRLENIACIIVSYNIGSDIYKCYNSIKKQVGQVVIVDNGSNKETIRALKNIESDSDTSIIYLKKNEGIAVALNYGVKAAIDLKYEWVLTMDNDSKAASSMIENMMNCYDSFPNYKKEEIVSIAPTYVQEGSKVINNLKMEYSYENLVITSGNLVKTDVFRKIGFFKENYFIDYVDNEFCLRILAEHKKIIQVNNAILEHNLGSVKTKKIFLKTIESTNHSPIRRYYLVRNSLDVLNTYKYLNIKHINNTKRILMRFILEILSVEDDRWNKIKHMYWGYKDYKLGKFGEFKRRG